MAFSKTGERLVGQVAKRQAITTRRKPFPLSKREMGSNYKVNIDGKDYTPQEISAMILTKLKTDAEAYLGEKVSQAVITVPAYFTDAPAPGHQGRRQDRGLGCQENHQRAYRRGFVLRHR